MMLHTVCRTDMASHDFSLSFSVDRTPAECWAVLTDVGHVAQWVSVVGDVTEIATLASYRAVLEDRLGPFKLKADLDITVPAFVTGETITIRADGEDRQIGSRITVDATLTLGDSDGVTDIDVTGRYEVTGRVATMGAGTIRKKADTIIAEFTEAAKRELG